MTCLQAPCLGAPLLLNNDDFTKSASHPFGALIQRDPDMCPVWTFSGFPKVPESYDNFVFPACGTALTGKCLIPSEFLPDSLNNSVRVANCHYDTGEGDSPECHPFPPRLESSLVLKTRIPLPDKFIGTQTVGIVTIANPAIDNEDSVLSGFWDNAPVEIRAGAPVLNKGKVSEEILQHKDFPIIFKGYSRNSRADERASRITLKDSSIDYDLGEEYEGTGGLEGDEQAKGDIKPRVYGSPFNVSPIKLEDNIYQFDFTGLKSIDAVRVKGVELTNGGSTTDVFSASPPSDTFVHDLDNGVIRIGGNVDGSVTGDPVNNGSLGSSILELASTVFRDTSPLTLADYAFGYYLTSQKSALDVIRDWVRSVSGWFWYTTAEGVFVLSAHNNPSGLFPSITVNEYALNTLRMEREVSPVHEYRYGYRKNWTIQDKDSLDDTLDEEGLELYSADYQYATASSPERPSSESMEIKSLLTVEAQAQRLAETELERDSSRRQIWRMTLPKRYFQQGVDEIIGFNIDRYNLRSKRGYIIETVDDTERQTADIKALVYG